jgi:hypothetical protein
VGGYSALLANCVQVNILSVLLRGVYSIAVLAVWLVRYVWIQRMRGEQGIGLGSKKWLATEEAVSQRENAEKRRRCT